MDVGATSARINYVYILFIKQSFGYARFLRGKRAGDDVMVKMG